MKQIPQGNFVFGGKEGGWEGGREGNREGRKREMMGLTCSYLSPSSFPPFNFLPSFPYHPFIFPSLPFSLPSYLEFHPSSFLPFPLYFPTFFFPISFFLILVLASFLLCLSSSSPFLSCLTYW